MSDQEVLDRLAAELALEDLTTECLRALKALRDAARASPIPGWRENSNRIQECGNVFVRLWRWRRKWLLGEKVDD